MGKPVLPDLAAQFDRGCQAARPEHEIEHLVLDPLLEIFCEPGRLLPL